jgi:hypothetical protein
METLIGILIYLAIVIICYYINKYIVVKYNKDNGMMGRMYSETYFLDSFFLHRYQS